MARSYEDSRVRVVQNSTNLGIPRTRNRAVGLARGEYVAMLDSDDVAHPERLERQVRHLDANPGTALVGSWACRIDPDGRPLRIRRFPSRSAEIRANLLFGRCFTNTSVMVRRAILDRHPYRTDLPIGEDLDVWSRIALAHEVANLPEVLVFYREHAGRATRIDAGLVMRCKMSVAANQLRGLGVEFSDEDLQRHDSLRRPKRLRPDAEFLAWARDWLERLHRCNRKVQRYPEPEFTRVLAGRWRQLCRRAQLSALRSRVAFWQSPLARLGCVDGLRRGGWRLARRGVRHASAW